MIKWLIAAGDTTGWHGRGVRVAGQLRYQIRRGEAQIIRPISRHPHGDAADVAAITITTEQGVHLFISSSSAGVTWAALIWFLILFLFDQGYSFWWGLPQSPLSGVTANIRSPHIGCHQPTLSLLADDKVHLYLHFIKSNIGMNCCHTKEELVIWLCWGWLSVIIIFYGLNQAINSPSGTCWRLLTTGAKLARILWIISPLNVCM